MPSELFIIECRYTDTQHNITQYRALLRWYHSELSAVMLSESFSAERACWVRVLWCWLSNLKAFVLCTGLLICKIVLFPFENTVIPTAMAPQHWIYSSACHQCKHFAKQSKLEPNSQDYNTRLNNIEHYDTHHNITLYGVPLCWVHHSVPSAVMLNVIRLNFIMLSVVVLIIKFCALVLYTSLFTNKIIFASFWKCNHNNCYGTTTVNLVFCLLLFSHYTECCLHISYSDLY